LGPHERALIQFVAWDVEPEPRREAVYDAQVPFLIRNEKRRVDAEPVRERQFFLRGFLRIHFVLEQPRLAVGESLHDEAAAVAGRVQHDVLGLRLEAALEHRLQRLVLRLVLVKRQIVDEQDEPLAAAAEQRQDAGIVAEMILRDLDKP